MGTEGLKAVDIWVKDSSFLSFLYRIFVSLDIKIIDSI